MFPNNDYIHICMFVNYSCNDCVTFGICGFGYYQQRQRSKLNLLYFFFQFISSMSFENNTRFFVCIKKTRNLSTTTFHFLDEARIFIYSYNHTKYSVGKKIEEVTWKWPFWKIHSERIQNYPEMCYIFCTYKICTVLTGIRWSAWNLKRKKNIIRWIL